MAKYELKVNKNLRAAVANALKMFFCGNSIVNTAVAPKICLGAMTYGFLTAGSIFVAPAAQALVMMESSSLETNDDPDADANWFDVTFKKNTDETVTFNFANLVESGNSTKISKIYFGTEGNFFNWFEQGVVEIDETIGNTDYSIDWDPSGANQITNNAGWDVEILGDNKNGSDNSTINPGDILSITFNLMDPAVTEEELALAFTSSPKQLGIAFHVQSIDGDYSEWYEAQILADMPVAVPVPSAILPVLTGLFSVAKKRKSGEAESTLS